MQSAQAKDDILNIAHDIVKNAQKSGATDTEVILIRGTDCTIEVRNGEIENSEYSDSTSIGIRVLIGKQSATVSGSNLAPSALAELVSRAVANAKFIPEDEYAQIASEDYLEHSPDYGLDIYDSHIPSLDILKENALLAEKAALDVEGVTNSEGAGCSFGRYAMGLVTSQGFSGLYHKTLFDVSCSVLSGEGTQMERDYDYCSATLFNGLISPDIIGRKAANRAVKRLNPIKMQAGKAPILFEPRVGRSFLGYFASAISADRILRGTSFLGNVLGHKVFADGISIIDDPRLKAGLASCPFDSEGVKNHRLEMIQNGILEAFLTHTASAKQLGLVNNGRAKRSVSGSPHPSATNMYIQNGVISLEDLMSDIGYGLYVTATIGHGINEITGDYSIGASGFLIEKGVLTVPVSEITIAGNLKEMFLNMTPANDLAFLSRKNVPTLRIDGMMIAS